MGYVYVKIFLGTPVHLGASELPHTTAQADAPRCVPTTLFVIIISGNWRCLQRNQTSFIMQTECAYLLPE